MEDLRDDKEACVKLGLAVFCERAAGTAQRRGHRLFTVETGTSVPKMEYGRSVRKRFHYTSV